MMMAAASCKRFSRKAWRISLEMVCPVMSNGTSENFIWHHPFSIVVLFDRAARATTFFSHHSTARLHVLAGDPAGSITSEKCGHLGDILRSADAIEGRQARAVIAVLLGQHVSFGKSRGENVDRDIARTELTRQRASKL